MTSLLQRAAAPLGAVSAATFATLSRLRGKRVFHPYGDAFEARISMRPNSARWVPALMTSPREHEAIVRFSRGLGLPESLPDFLGLALKLPDLYGPGWDQDFLFVTSGADTVSRHALVPSRGFLARPYSTVLPYRRHGALVTYGAKPHGIGDRAATMDALKTLVDAGSVAFDITAAQEGDPFVVIGRLDIVALRDPALSDKLRFNPWNSFADTRPAGALNELRRESYRASQAARPDTKT
jgi:hypothetical protein